MNNTNPKVGNSPVDRNIVRLQPFLSLTDRELNRLTITQYFSAFSSNRAVMYEDVLTCLAGTKTKSLGYIKPLHNTLLSVIAAVIRAYIPSHLAYISLTTKAHHQTTDKGQYVNTKKTAILESPVTDSDSQPTKKGAGTAIKKPIKILRITIFKLILT